MGKGKYVRGALEALTDAYKRTFAPETYYHYSDSPNIKEFNPEAEDSWGQGTWPARFKERGATYFTKDPRYAEDIFREQLFIKNKSGAMPLSTRKGNIPTQYFEEYLKLNPGAAPSTYPVKIKTKDIFDFQNQKQVDDLISELSPDPDLIRDGTLDDVIYLIRQGNWEVLEEESIRKILKDKGYRGYRTNEQGTVGLYYPDEGDVRSVHAKFDPKKWRSGNILASVPAGALATGALGNLADVEE